MAKACCTDYPPSIPLTPLLAPLFVPRTAPAKGLLLCYFPGVSRQPHTNAFFSGQSDAPWEELAWRLALKGRAVPPQQPHSVIASSRGEWARLPHGLASFVSPLWHAVYTWPECYYSLQSQHILFLHVRLIDFSIAVTQPFCQKGHSCPFTFIMLAPCDAVTRQTTMTAAGTFSLARYTKKVCRL